MPRSEIGLLSLLLALLLQACVRGGHSEGEPPLGVFPVQSRLVVGLGGKGRVSAQGVGAREALRWTVQPSTLAQVKSTKDEHYEGWYSSWSGEAEVTAGASTGQGMVEISIQTSEGPKSGIISLSVVTGIQVGSMTDVLPYTPGSVFYPSLPVSWPPYGTSDVSQGLLWEALDPLPGGSISNLGPESLPSTVKVEAPTVSGTYRLRAISIADPSASGTYSFKVQ